MAVDTEVLMDIDFRAYHLVQRALERIKTIPKTKELLGSMVTRIEKDL